MGGNWKIAFYGAAVGFGMVMAAAKFDARVASDNWARELPEEDVPATEIVSLALAWPKLAPARDFEDTLDLPGPAALPPTRGVIAVVIDDLGLNRRNTERAIALPAEISLSFLPYAPRVDRQARAARAAGHEIWLHLPMEPKAAARDPGPHALLLDRPPAVRASEIRWNLDRFGGYVGVNNHMGSRFTENRAAMRQLFAALQARGLMFLDSRTTAHSAGAPLAAQLGLDYVERDVFLDNAASAPKVAAQLKTAERRALEHGTAIAIGHPHGETLSALEDWIASLDQKGLKLVPASEISEMRGTPLWRARLASARGASIGGGR